MGLSDDKLIVLTGGAGFIGSGVLKQLNELGLSNIVVVDNLGMTEKWKNLVGKRFVDYVAKENLFEWLEGRAEDISGFIHLGACSSTVELNASYLAENNFRYTLRLAEYALKWGLRFVYASSAATYGDGLLGFDDDENRLEELKPLNMYGFSKHMFDLWAKKQGVLGQIAGLKYFNVFGPNEYHKGRMSSAIVKMVPQAQEKGKITLFKSSEPDKYADGQQVRDFVYVKDVAKITSTVFLEPGINGIFNVGSGIASTWNQMAESVFKALEMPINIEYIDMPQDLVGKYQNYTLANVNKIKKAMKKAKVKQSLAPTKFEKAVIEYVRQYLLLDARW